MKKAEFKSKKERNLSGKKGERDKKKAKNKWRR